MTRLAFESLGTGRVVRSAGRLALDPLVLQTLLDHIPMRATAVGRDHCYLYANHTFLESMGLTAAQVISRPVREVLGEAMYAAYLPVAERLFGGEALRWEGWMDYRGRGARYFEQHLLPFARDGGEVEAIITFGRDVTELKQREEELSRQLDELQTTQALKGAIVDHALAALVSTDAEGHVVEFNPAAEAMFGRRRAEVLGRPVGEVIIPHRHREAHDAGMARMAHGGPARIMGKRVEMPALRADGSEFPVEMVLWRTEVSGRAYYTASMVDLTERQKAAREIERQREALRQSEKLTAMGSLLAGVAHELNNPLAIVLGRAALLEEKAAGQPALEGDARRIREAAERCGRIVRTFLNMARARPGERSAVQLNDLARAAADILGYNLRSHGIQVSLALDPALPTVLADGDQIGQIVLNLLVNAQQALATVPQAQRVISVSTGVEPRRSESPTREVRIWLRVADQGPGVAEENRERLFEPYFTTKPEGQGTGLGLAVSRSIARDHGGDLVLERPEQGASFRLSLPLSGQASAAPSEPVPLEQTAPAQARVLVVDDEIEIADLLRDLLETAGYDVMTAESGAVALALLDEAHFDAVVSDLHMPDVDGAALWREIKARHPALARRMLFVTGDTLSPSVRQFLEDARCDSLAKPFQKGDLLAKLGELLART
jgi:two-component system NtrC family sensor kinase